MKTLIISVPKSGTFLLSEILQEMGLGKAGYHVGEEGIYDYSKVSIEEGRKNPRSCLKSVSFKDALNMIPEFATSHIKYSEEAKELLRDFKLLLLTRDIKEIILSGCIWCLASGRRSGPWKYGKTKKDVFRQWIDTYGHHLVKEHFRIMEWSRYSYVFDYHDIKNGSEKLGELYGIDNIKELTKSAKEKRSVTKSSPYDPNDYWDEKSLQTVENLIKLYEMRYAA